MQESLQDMLDTIVDWASNEGAEGILLVGSHAHGTARPDSDIDLIFLIEDCSRWLADHSWAERFGKTDRTSFEDWGGVKTVRVFYQNGPEVEFNFAGFLWASTKPIDAGTFRVVSDGTKILFDPTKRLERLLDAVESQVR